MRPIQHPSNNRVLGAPKDWDQKTNECTALAITDAIIDGLECVVSFWMPTKEELQLLNAGYPIALSVVGGTMPPVMLFIGAK